MTTPICDFVKSYAEQKAMRAHMPGHKGRAFLGMEALDITEIPGADVLYHATGIIAESRENVRKLYDTYASFYSTEGSSLCVRAMVYLLVQHAKKQKKAPLIFAARNAHKSFMQAVALLDAEITWLYPETAQGLLSCELTAEAVERALSDAAVKPTAVFLTSPDYLGNLANISAISAVCHAHGVLLAVDNAHGAYLHFLKDSLHPIALGADICCDSAHKTLPTLTGGAYLHIGKNAPALFGELAESALALFASTSPSYLILQSLDATNAYLANGFREKLAVCISRLDALKQKLSLQGFTLAGTEPLKLTLCPKPYGYTGEALAAHLSKHNIVCEFFDRDYVTLMFTPEHSAHDFETVENALSVLPNRTAITEAPPPLQKATPTLTVRQALLSPSVATPTAEALGKTVAEIHVACPPAIPILVCGERIDNTALECLNYYGVEFIRVVDA